jgi:hypothetical protein
MSNHVAKLLRKACAIPKDSIAERSYLRLLLDELEASLNDPHDVVELEELQRMREAIAVARAGFPAY